jgi:hypothetical protein
MTEALARFPRGYFLRHMLVQTLVSALEASRGPQAALDAIVNDVAATDRFDRGYLRCPSWIGFQAQRARLLRRLGRVAEAESVEAELRKYLAFADSDMLIVRQLAKQRR